MASVLEIYTLGGVRLLLNREPVVGLTTRKTEALLIYLASTRRSQPREVLADLFWAEHSQDQALGNLRKALSNLHQVLGNCLIISRSDVAINPVTAVWLDRAALEDGLDSIRQQGRLNNNTARQAADIAALYQGEFLQGFTVYDCPEFERWAAREREYLHRLIVENLTALVAFEIEQQAYQPGMTHAQRLLALDPLNEGAHRQMMLLLARTGQRSAALTQYETFKKMLQEELDIPPEAETQRLFEQIRAGELGAWEVHQGTPGKSAERNPSYMEDEPPAPGCAPFKGLQYFDEKDAHLFFGRSKVTARLVEMVCNHRLLAVVGASGSGKSSVVRAGLVPALKNGQPEAWETVIMTPSAQPLEALALRLTQGVESVTASAALADDLSRDARSLHLFLRKRGDGGKDQGGKGCNFLLVVDQFEELFTMCRIEAERQAFIDNLIYAAQVPNSRVYVLIALRADFYNHLAEYEELRQAVARHQEYLGEMNVEELRQVIEEPARQGGWKFAPGLVELVLREVGADADCSFEPGALPLLSHALLETWNHRRGKVMNLESYAESGGVHRAIARTAERLYSQELNSTQQVIARNIFLRLTELGEGTQDTRRRAPLRELFPAAPHGDHKDVEDVLVKLADARLIITGEGTVEVAHEALIREWPMLREWLTQNREGLLLQRRLTEAAQEWELLERDAGALYRGARLIQVQEWAKDNSQQLNEQEQAFLDASRLLADQEEAEKEAARERELAAAQRLADEQSRAAKRLRKRGIFLSLALIAAIILTGVAALFAKRSMDANVLANEKAQLAFSRELAAAALSNISVDSQRSLLLSMEAAKLNDNPETENALHQAVQASRLRDSIFINDNPLIGVKFAPDGSHMATSSMDGNIYLWSMDASGEKIDKSSQKIIPNAIDFDGRKDTAGYTLDFSPDGLWLVGAAEKQSANIWEVATGKLLRTLSGHSEDVLSVAFSPDGQMVATGSADDTVKVWESATGRELKTLTGFDGNIVSIMFDADGKNLIAFSETGHLIAWEIRPTANHLYEFLQTYDFNLERGGSLAVSPDGSRLAVTTCWNLMVYDASKASAVSMPVLVFNSYAHSNCINGVSFNNSGNLLYSGSADGIIKAWDAATGQQVSNLPGNIGGVGSIALDPQGTHLLAANYGGSLNLWDIDPGGNEEWFTFSGSGSTGFITEDGNMFITDVPVSATESRVDFWNFTPAGLEKVFSNELILSYSGYYAASSNPARFVVLRENPATRQIFAEVWDPATGKLWKSFPVFTSASDSGPICQPDVDCLTLQTCSADGTQISIVNDLGVVSLWDMAAEKIAHVYKASKSGLTYAHFSPDGSMLSTVNYSEPVGRIWDTRSGKMITEFVNQTGGLHQGRFSYDGKRLITGATDRIVRVWDVRTGKQLFALPEQTALVHDVTFSPDGKYLATAAYDRTVKLWDAASGKEILVFNGTYVFFPPDSKHLITTDLDGIVRGYYLDNKELMEKARSLLIRTWTDEECVNFLHTSTCPPAP